MHLCLHIFEFLISDVYKIKNNSTSKNSIFYVMGWVYFETLDRRPGPRLVFWLWIRTQYSHLTADCFKYLVQQFQNCIERSTSRTVLELESWQAPDRKKGGKGGAPWNGWRRGRWWMGRGTAGSCRRNLSCSWGSMEKHTSSRRGTLPQVKDHLLLVQWEAPIQVMDRPGNSPDLILIENAWAWMKKQLSNTSKATNF